MPAVGEAWRLRGRLAVDVRELSRQLCGCMRPSAAAQPVLRPALAVVEAALEVVADLLVCAFFFVVFELATVVLKKCFIFINLFIK